MAHSRTRLFQPPPAPQIPPVPAEFFSAPLDLEIGAGVGQHAITYALKHPERYLIALEQTHERSALFERRVAQHAGLGRLWRVQAKAEAFVPHFLPPRCLDRVFILYPNPWPKPKHLNRRFYGMPFMGCLISRLKEGGELILATNKFFYYEEAKLSLTTQWGLEGVQSGALSSSWHPRTPFEKKYLERGETCYQGVFRKRAPKASPRERELMAIKPLERKGYGC